MPLGKSQTSPAVILLRAMELNRNHGYLAIHRMVISA